MHCAKNCKLMQSYPLHQRSMIAIDLFMSPLSQGTFWLLLPKTYLTKGMAAI